MAKDPFSDEAAQAFLQGSSTAAKWPKIGYVVEIEIEDYRMAQQRHYDLNEPLFWAGKKQVPESQAVDKSDNARVMQLIIEGKGEPTGETWKGLQNTRVALPEDDGRRVMYVKANLQRAIAKAFKDAGVKLSDAKGARLRVERIADVPNPDSKKQDAHDFRAVLTPADPGKAVDDFLNATPDENPFGS